MITSRYTFNDHGLRAITSAVSKLGAARTRVGVLGSDGDAVHPTGNGLKVWEVAALQEFGTENGHIPPRSFIRSTLNDLVWVRSLMARAAQRVVFGKATADGALDWLGKTVVMAIQNRIMQSVPPPNAEQTVMWKGHAHTLIGTTSVVSKSVSHDVVKGFSTGGMVDVPTGGY